MNAVAEQIGTDATALRPFRVDVPEAELTELRRRIKSTRLPEKEPVADMSQGVPLATVEKLARYWADDYDWRRSEARINAFPNFITEIDGVDIHVECVLNFLVRGRQRVTRECLIGREVCRQRTASPEQLLHLGWNDSGHIRVHADQSRRGLHRHLLRGGAPASPVRHRGFTGRPGGLADRLPLQPGPDCAVH